MYIELLSGSITSDIFETAVESATGFISIIVGAISAVVPIFWDSTLNTGSGGLTFIGTVSVIGLGITVAVTGFAFVKGLIKM